MRFGALARVLVAPVTAALLDRALVTGALLDVEG